MTLLKKSTVLEQRMYASNESTASIFANNFENQCKQILKINASHSSMKLIVCHVKEHGEWSLSEERSFRNMILLYII